MAKLYCECCGRDYLRGHPDCRCAYAPRCGRCRACEQHCGCAEKDAAFRGFLEWASREVEGWPEWKKSALGAV